MNELLLALTLVTILGCGIVAGIFFAFSTFIMRALRQIPTQAGMQAMQSINVTVLSPWFLGVFFGTGIVCLLELVYAVYQGLEAAAVWRIAGSLCYLLGTLVVTGVFNVPRNERLAKLSSESPEGEAYWQDYLVTWTFWNHVRTVAAALAALFFSLALTL